MNEKLKEYFEDLEEKNLRKVNNIIVRDGKRVIQGSSQAVRFARRKIYQISVDDTPYIGKLATDDKPLYLHELASSRMFGDLGILTPPNYPIRIKTKNAHPQLGIMSQDVTKLDGLIVVPATAITEFENLPIQPQFGGLRNLSPWHIFTDSEVKDKCLEIMTEKCYEEMMNYFMLEELRGSCDTHKGNYFFYKTSENGKYEGIIPIDFESSIPLGYEGFKRDMFDYSIFDLHHPSCLPFKNWADIGQDGNFGNYVYSMNHAGRIYMLKRLIHTGQLSDDQIAFLKDAISYDFPQLIKDTGEDLSHHIQESTRNYTSDVIYRLWEYNYDQLNTELQ